MYNYLVELKNSVWQFMNDPDYYSLAAIITVVVVSSFLMLCITLIKSIYIFFKNYRHWLLESELDKKVKRTSIGLYKSVHNLKQEQVVNHQITEAGFSDIINNINSDWHEYSDLICANYFSLYRSIPSHNKSEYVVNLKNKGYLYFDGTGIYFKNFLPDSKKRILVVRKHALTAGFGSAKSEWLYDANFKPSEGPRNAVPRYPYNLCVVHIDGYGYLIVSKDFVLKNMYQDISWFINGPDFKLPTQEEKDNQLVKLQKYGVDMEFIGSVEFDLNDSEMEKYFNTNKNGIIKRSIGPITTMSDLRKFVDSKEGEDYLRTIRGLYNNNKG